IEDTDQNRYVANAEQYINNALDWCGISPDETIGKNEKFGPYRQSERKEIYKKYALELINSGNAYYAFDTAEDLDRERKGREEKGKTFIYNWHNREKGKLVNSLVLSEEEVAKRIKNGDKYVVRFKMYQPESDASPEISTTDLIRGKVTFKKEILDDKILFKSDGMPTYHLANIVDDHLMEISHVIRGEEWLPSVPLHIALYDAFGWKAPEFAHLPLILKPTGKGKLSKRDGDKLGFPVFPLAYTNEQTQEVSKGFKEEGYFSETVINFLAFLGWNPGTEQELFSLDELIQEFDLSRVNKAGARFDPDKTRWFNQQYLQSKPNEELAELFIKEINVILNDGEESQQMRSFDFAQDDKKHVTKVVSLIKERATFVSDFWNLSKFFFVAPTSYDAKASKKQWKEGTPQIMKDLIEVLKSIEDFSSQNIETIVKEWLTKEELGFGKVMPPFRLALVGAMSG
ncbi:MAG: glutamate--tRNA ligase, partial [Flavobacteriaceae bacterium]|nr:glutamate--tRNA ligase [Flavobacteriaceae bacterium]